MLRSHPYMSLPSASHWRRGATAWARGDFQGLYEPRFDIEKSTAIATAGSCFAQHIGQQFRSRGYNYLDLEPPPPRLAQERRKAFGYELFSARYGNIYTSRQLLQLVQRAYGPFSPEAVWEENGKFFDALRPTIEPDGFNSHEELMHMRERHHKAVRKMFSTADVFVFTMGLTEAWINKSDNVAFPLCPGTPIGTFDEAEHKFVNLSYAEVFLDMERVMNGVRKRNPSLRFLLTVSPVPLAATATGRHVVDASSYSKSVLRSVAGALYEKYDFVDYFPSYEIITSPVSGGRHYSSNMRDVTPEGVATVMNYFFNGEAAPIARTHSSANDQADLEMIRDVEIICDEEQLDMAGSA